MQRNKALGIAAADANNWKPAMYCPQHQPMPRIRDVPPVGGEAFDDEAGERHRFQHVSDQGDKVHFSIEIDRAVVVPVAGALGDRDLGPAGSVLIWVRRARRAINFKLGHYRPARFLGSTESG